jgi:hypothetical protein
MDAPENVNVEVLQFKLILDGESGSDGGKPITDGFSLPDANAEVVPDCQVNEIHVHKILPDW